MRLFAVGAITPVALLTAAASTTNPADAAAGVTTGIWWQEEPSDGAVPAPPTVPEGGLWVDGNRAGTQAESALRVAVTGTAEGITLKVHQGNVSTPDTVEACVVADTWTPPASSPGTMSEAPTPRCEAGKAVGVASNDGSSMTFAVGTIDGASDGTLNLVFIPGTAAGSGPVDVTFDKPTPAVVTTAPSAAAPSSTGGSGGTTPAAPETTSAVSNMQPAGAPPPPSDSSAGTASAGPAPAVAPALGAVPVGRTPIVAQPLTSSQVASGDQARAVAIVLFAIFGFWAAAIVSRSWAHAAASGARFTLYSGAPPASSP